MVPFCGQIVLVLLLVLLNLCSGNQSPAPHHACNHGHAHDHYDHHHPHHDEGHEDHHHHVHGNRWEEAGVGESRRKLPEELAEEEDLELYGFGSHHDDHEHHGHPHHDVGGGSYLTGSELWIHALGCSLLVSMASLVCLIIIPVIFVHGKPSQGVVDSLAAFGAGAMLGDAFLHQLPHAFGGEHSHSHDHEHHVHSTDEQSHAHSLKDLSVGMSILAGIVLFLIVEKIVRYVEEVSGGSHSSSHGHYHHKPTKKLKGDRDAINKSQAQSSEEKTSAHANGEGEEQTKVGSTLKKRNKMVEPRTAELDEDAAHNGTLGDQDQPAASPSNLVFGYLNLISDGVHNFTDGMALGSAFLLYGSVGGWSRTMFLLAHELPQEIGDFGILVRSGFSVSKALFFNFLSALVALAGTALALVLGHDPGYSSLIEGFTAGGFIYIAVAGVLAEMNNSGKTAVRTSVVHLTTLVMGMGVALCISLVE